MEKHLQNLALWISQLPSFKAAWIYAAIGLVVGLLIAHLINRLIFNIRLQAKQTQLDSEQIEFQALLEETQELQNKLTLANDRAARVLPLENKLEQMQASLSQINEDNIRLETEYKSASAHMQDKLRTLEATRKQFREELMTLSEKIYTEKTERFNLQSQARITEVLKPFREQIDGFKKRVEDTQLNQAKDNAALREEISQLKNLNERINEEAANLTKALKSDNKLQGNWGEMILERVLETSGLRKGIEYDTQISFKDDDGNLFRPDVVVRLPEGRDMIVDSKVSLNAYHDYVSTTDKQARATALKKHIDSIKTHIDDLVNKDYANLEGIKSPDFVLMFMPIESAYIEAQQAAPEVFTNAFSRRIVIVSPSTLLATLRTVENVWRLDKQNKNAMEIADSASKIYDKLRGFVEDMEKLGNQLQTSQNTYDSAMNKLSTGKGNLIRQAENFVELGIKVKKKLPESITNKDT